jgi:predicted secreted hydrolase
LNRQPDIISFPHDAAKHPISNVEWWYCFAMLSGSRGNRYAVMASFFRVGELAVPKGHYMIHSLVRLNTNQYESQSELDRMLSYQMAGVYLPAYLITKPRDRHTWNLYKQLLKGSLPSPHHFMTSASVQSRPTRLAYGNNRMTFKDDLQSEFQLQLTFPSTRIRLNYVPLKPISLIDEEGKVNGLRYYSVTRNRVFGELYSAGNTETLRGEGWFDHQWGRNYGLLQGDGWDWFGIQLHDGNDLLINRLRRADADAVPYTVAKLIRKNGSVTTSERVTLQPTNNWGSLLTSAEYPLEWQISLPDFSMSLHITPLMNHQEMPIIGPLQAIWEGVCAVNGEVRSPVGTIIQVKGHGFVELVGYPQKYSSRDCIITC